MPYTYDLRQESGISVDGKRVSVLKWLDYPYIQLEYGKCKVYITSSLWRPKRWVATTSYINACAGRVSTLRTYPTIDHALMAGAKKVIELEEKRRDKVKVSTNTILWDYMERTFIDHEKK